MNQLQIKQEPFLSSINTQRIAGSWFPTGYYGHFRAKSRADLCNYFRQISRPNPPKKFLDRQNSEATTHMFSQHDNRSKFENDPLVRGTTEAGFGKRKSQTNARGEFDPFFISWIPKNVDRKTYIDDIKTTSYANDYNSDSTSSQIFSTVQSINSSSLPSSPITAYSTVYNHGQPNNQQSKQIRRETFQRYATTLTRRSQLQCDERSTSVASCLEWNNTDSGNKTTKTNDKIINFVVPITLKPRINSVTQKKPYQSQSMPTFKTMTQPLSNVTTSREHYNTNVLMPIRAATSFEQTHTHSMQSLISKYM